jgi:mono/diheme cytochrome c family protein
VALMLALATGCSGAEEQPATPAREPAAAPANAPAAAAEADAGRGEEIYAKVCTTCHGADPSQDGTTGPAIAGASLELVEAKVLRGEYPPGYTPKRPSAAMPPLPYLNGDVANIAAYLQAAKGS